MKVNMTPNPLDVVTIHASQGDTEARQWEFELHNNGELIDTSDVKEQLVFKAYKGGTEQLLPENGSTPTTSPFLGDIRYPQGLLADQEFTYRQSPTEEDGLAKVTDIKGNTLVWNQLVNGMATSSADGITTAYNSSTNVITITNNSRTTNYGTGSTRGNIKTITITSGHKYLFCIDNVVTGVIVTHDTGSGLNDIPFNSVYTATTGTGNFRLRVTKDYDFVTAHPINSVVSIKIMCIDLTILNDSHITDYNSFKTYFPLSYYAYGQYLLNFNGSGIKTTGKNLLNCQWSGSGSGGGLTWTFNNDGSVTINGTSTSAGIMCWNYQYSGATSAGTQNNGRKYIPNGEYILSGGISNKLNVQIRVSTVPSGGDTEFISASGSEVHVTIDDRYPYNWVRLMYEANKTFNNETCYPMIRYDTAEGGFEPYHAETTTLPISTYFPTGMKRAGNVYDELTENKAITRIGRVDLGSLNWTYDSSVPRFISSDIVSAVAVPSSNSNIANIKCAVYDSISLNGLAQSNKCIAVSTGGVISAKDTAYTSASAFKSSLSGVYLYYELATESETSFTTASLVTENAEIPLSNEDGVLIGKCTEEISAEPGFIDAKIKLTDSDGTCYSNKLQLHVERSPQ